jgi:hypothetical protein
MGRKKKDDRGHTAAALFEVFLEVLVYLPRLIGRFIKNIS